MDHINCTNADVVKHAIRGNSADSSTGNMTTRPSYPRNSWGSWLPDRLAAIIRQNSDEISQVIYSYSTPIAWKHGDRWITPAVSYTTTTSTKHQTHLYRLPNRVVIPADCGLSEYQELIENRIKFDQTQNKMMKGAA